MRRSVCSSLLPVWVLTMSLALACLPLSGQTAASGTLAGVVSDPSGAVIAGATITVVDSATGTKFNATSTSSGRYIFTTLPPGTYDVTVDAAGFSKAKVSRQVIKVG